MKISASIVVDHDKTAARIAGLHREATVYKSNGRWDAAIKCLRKAVDLMIDCKVAYPTERWTRLGIFLQQAGRHREAMEYFGWLLSDVDRCVQKELGHNTELVRQASAHNRRVHIYDKMRLACSREKRSDDATRYTILRDNHHAEWSSLRKLADEELRAILSKRISERDRSR